MKKTNKKGGRGLPRHSEVKEGRRIKRKKETQKTNGSN